MSAGSVSLKAVHEIVLTGSQDHPVSWHPLVRPCCGNHPSVPPVLGPRPDNRVRP